MDDARVLRRHAPGDCVVTNRRIDDQQSWSQRLAALEAGIELGARLAEIARNAGERPAGEGLAVERIGQQQENGAPRRRGGTVVAEAGVHGVEFDHAARKCESAERCAKITSSGCSVWDGMMEKPLRVKRLRVGWGVLRMA
jgi:hypothetical protein